MADSLFQGAPQQATSYTTSTSETPKWMQDAIYNQIQWATNLAQKPYESYTQPLVAGATPEQQQAWQRTQSNLGAWQPTMDVATQGMQDLTGATSVGNVGAYMSPYTEGVTNRIAQLGARNLTENLLPGVSDAFVRSGSFGGTRMGEFGERALRDTQEAILGQQAGALQQGYTQALGASAADLSRQQGALGALAQLGAQGQQLRAADVGALETVGQTQQQQQQRELDAAYQQYQLSQQYPKSQMDWLSTQVRGMAPLAPTVQSSTGATTGASYSPSPLSQMASLYSVGSGLSKM